nr:MAG TPA: hypothetical protein [Caudoviricetes sp.]
MHFHWHLPILNFQLHYSAYSHLYDLPMFSLLF